MYKFCVGCEDNAAQIEQIEAQIEYYICNVHHTGYTLYTAEGATYVDGTVVRDEVSLIYEVAYLDSSEASKLLEEISSIENVGIVLSEGYYADLALSS